MAERITSRLFEQYLYSFNVDLNSLVCKKEKLIKNF